MPNILKENNWKYINDLLLKPKVDVSKLTYEERADLIIERLKNPPTENLLEDLISAKLSALIAEDIDKEILAEMSKTTKGQK